MKILSWNINGIRASKVDLKELFDSLDADVICLQETKVTRDMLDEATAIVEGYNSYFSFSRKRSGYSGVANFCRNSVTPEKAEEGLSGTLKTSDDGSVGHYGNRTSFTDEELKDLDAEGRAIITQHRIRTPEGKDEMVAIVNVYCPRFDPEREDRHLYKLRFYALLQTRAEALLESGSHVVILGDINTTHKDLDVCDTTDEASIKKPSRRWLNQMMRPEGRDDTIDAVINQEEFAAATPHTKGGMFIDTYRHLYPDKEGAFTNWCTLTNARSTNYGRRLDYILGSVQLVSSCLTGADILQAVEGSDHCPITIQLDCTAVPARTCPPQCTKYMPEFQGKQQKLSTYFTKMIRQDTKPVTFEATSEVKQTFQKQDGNKRVSENGQQISPKLKRQKTEMKKSVSGSKQANLMSFFMKTSVKSISNDSVKHGVSSSSEVNNKDTERHRDQGSVDETCVSKYFSVLDKKIGDTNGGADSVKVVREKTNETANAWKGLLGGLGPAPLCKGHQEPCVLRTVKKAGPNKGKQFYTCARGEGLKTNPEARCDYFKWIEKKKK